MSYILDALRRSQAERERGQVPGLDARPAAVPLPPGSGVGSHWRAIALGGVALAAGAALLLWWLRSSAPPVPPAGVTVRVPDAAPRPAPAPETAVAPGPAPLPIVVSAPVPVPAPAVAPTPAPATMPAPMPVPAPAAASAAAPPATTLLSTLNPALRSQLPPLAMGGSIWSDNALSRFVIVNGLVVREGEAAAPGVVVERIEPKRVLLRWRELRLEVPL